MMNSMGKKAAMEMSVGTVVTIVLLMAVLALGIVLVQKIFTGATESVDTINEKIMGEINNMFSEDDKDLVVSLGRKQTANVKQGTKDFGFVIGFSPDDPTDLMGGQCSYDIEARPGDNYCVGLPRWSISQVEDWIITGKTSVEFSEIQRNVGYELIRLKIPEDIPVCIQRFGLKVECPGGYSSSTYFDISVVKKGFL